MNREPRLPWHWLVLAYPPNGNFPTAMHGPFETRELAEEKALEFGLSDPNVFFAPSYASAP